MGISLFSSTIVTLVAPLAVLALVATIAAIMLLRDHLRIEKHVRALEIEIERLQDENWQVGDREERYRSLVEAQLDVIVQLDTRGRITFANEGFARLTGHERQNLFGSVARPIVIEATEARIKDGARHVEEAINSPSGLRWIAWMETTIQGRNGQPELLRTGRDVTERVSAEKALNEARTRAEAASEAKSRFLATVSHEFRTPLNGILGMADLLVDTRIDPEQTTYIRAIKTSGEALLSLIDEILDFSRIEAGRIDLACEPFDLYVLVEGVIELLAPRAQDKGIEIAAHLDQNIPRYVMGDRDRMRQILVNLAGNAVKFTEFGGVGLRVAFDFQKRIQFSVCDTGPGIAQERQAALFEEFEQGDGSASRRYNGTGLGLAITRRIVESMKGVIHVDSHVGIGSTFSVALNLPEVNNEVLENDPRIKIAQPLTPINIEGQRILIVANSPFEAPFIAKYLEQANAKVILADGVAGALTLIEQDPFDVLMADCALGEEGARAVAHEARRAGIKRTIVLLSPFERRDFGSPSAAGFNAYLVKPVRMQSLMQRITEDMPFEAIQAPPIRASLPRPKNAYMPRVLLAEDNEINALLAVKVLEKCGALVDWAKNGHEAVMMAEHAFHGQRPDYDLVLMDIRMPELDGHEATRRIRRLEASLGRATPYEIVALTANALKEDEMKARAAGLNGFLAKPFELSALRNILDNIRKPDTPKSLAQAS